MTTTSKFAAHRMCVSLDWSANLQVLQKALYLSQAAHLVEHGEPLVNEHFHSTDVGPILPSVDQDLKGFGRRPVKNIFWFNRGLLDHAPEARTIDLIAERIKSRTPSREVGAWLVKLTHMDGGGWAKHYRPGGLGVVIPNRDILEHGKALLFQETRSAA